jgi:DNA-binding NtrC family response regulator
MKTQILVIGNHEKIMEILVRHINYNENWNAIPAKSEEEARLLFTQNHFDLVLLSSGFEEEIERNLTIFFKQKNPSIEVIPHYGGGTGLLQNEIYEAIEKLKK